MLVPMRHPGDIVLGRVFVIERLFWRGTALPLGTMKLRWLLTASQVGYHYPGKLERDALDVERCRSSRTS